MKKIESENILLRKFQTEDAEEAFKNWAGIKEIADLSDYRVHTSVEETKQMIEVELGDGEGERYTLAILHNRIVNEKTGEKNNKVIYSIIKK